MKKETEKYVKTGVAVVLISVALYFGYKFVNKKIIEYRLRNAKKKEEAKGVVDINVTTPAVFQGSTGKMLIAKNDVNVRSGAYVNNGVINNFIGKVLKGKPIGKILSGEVSGDGYVWYRVTPITANFVDDASLGKAKKTATTGYVREDNTIIK